MGSADRNARPGMQDGGAAESDFPCCLRRVNVAGFIPTHLGAKRLTHRFQGANIAPAPVPPPDRGPGGKSCDNALPSAAVLALLVEDGVPDLSQRVAPRSCSWEPPQWGLVEGSSAPARECSEAAKQNRFLVPPQISVRLPNGFERIDPQHLPIVFGRTPIIQLLPLREGRKLQVAGDHESRLAHDS